MASSTEGLTRHDLEAKIVKRSWEDEGFRKEFTADPVAIHQETPGSWHIVLPAKPPHIDELTEVDLERIAGGTTPAITVVVSVVAAPISVGILTISIGENNGW
jgi:hypothetical protein